MSTSWHRTQFLDTLIFLADGTSAIGWQQHQHYRHHYRNNSVHRWRNNVGTTRVLNLQPTTPTPAWLRQPDSRAPLQSDKVPQRCNTLRTQHHQDFQLEATSPTGTAGLYKHRSCHFTSLYHPKTFYYVIFLIELCPGSSHSVGHPFGIGYPTWGSRADILK